jgi:hypothetical protein
MLVRFEVFTAVTMKNAIFLDVALCRACVNRRHSLSCLVEHHAMKMYGEEEVYIHTYLILVHSGCEWSVRATLRIGQECPVCVRWKAECGPDLMWK